MALGLAAARYLLIGALVSVVGASLWLVVRALAFSEPATDGLLSVHDIQRLDLSISWTTRLVKIALPLQGLWAWTAVVCARRARLVPTKSKVAAVATALAFVFAITGLIDEQTSWLGGIVVIAAAASSAGALLAVHPIICWLGRSRILAWVWAGIVLAMGAFGVALGSYRPIDADSSSGWPAFVGLVLIQVAVIAVLVAAGFAIEFEDEFQDTLSQAPRQPAPDPQEVLGK